MVFQGKIPGLPRKLRVRQERLLLRPLVILLEEDGNFTAKRLKEQCHEDFAVLSQFCAKINTLRL